MTIDLIAWLTISFWSCAFLIAAVNHEKTNLDLQVFTLAGIISSIVLAIWEVST